MENDREVSVVGNDWDNLDGAGSPIALYPPRQYVITATARSSADRDGWLRELQAALCRMDYCKYVPVAPEYVGPFSGVSKEECSPVSVPSLLGRGCVTVTVKEAENPSGMPV
jgi:hypothetical protein